MISFKRICGYKSHNPNWPDHSHKILITGGSGSGKNNVLLNLIKDQRPNIDKLIRQICDKKKVCNYKMD